MKCQKGFTITELMVSMLIFAIVGAGMMGFTSNALRELGDQSRLSFATLELKNAISMLSSEVKMSSAISPYIPGNSSAATNCSASLSVSSNAVRFLIAEDDPTATATAGIKPYYVGYSYDAASNRLIRGEIAGTTTTSCTLPAGDPASTSVAKTLTEKVTRIDSDGDGTLDPVFSLSGDVLTINLGVEVLSPSGNTITQDFSTRVYLRTN